ncbi:MAG: sulfite exporter TauE/SafE family protein [Ardenticatenaceae bacterium]|nr:sulfite exporter TauE/SafE family protein [Ardenticatenaceae bacterium]
MSLPQYPDYFWVTAVIAILIVGLSKAGFGGGVGAISTPLLALTIPVPEAAALLLPLLILADLSSLPHYRHHVDRYSVRWLLPGALVGILLGSLFFGYFSHNEHVLKIGIGVISLLFVAYQVGRHWLTEALEGKRPLPSTGLGFGFVAGFTSTLAHVGAPPVTMYLLPQKLPRQIFVGTTLITFTVINLVKLIPYGILGLLRIGNLTTTLILAPVVFVGIRLGIYLNERFSDVWFNRVIYAMLLFTGIQLIFG